MKNPLLATAAGLLLLACGGMQKQAPSIQPAAAQASPGQFITSLERACLSDPMDAAKWAALASALEEDGQRERAARMNEQAAMLRAHDVRRDYALLRDKAAVPRVVAPDPLSAMPRTQVRQIGAALVEVLRVAPAAPPVPPAASPAPVLPMPALVRLEISNGNGVAGAAARLARSLRVAGYQTVRLTNVKNFDVPLSRIEYQRGRQAMAQSLSERLGLPLTAQGGDSPATDMRIVLGRDAIDAGRIK
jgi:hypothetical protein